MNIIGMTMILLCVISTNADIPFYYLDDAEFECSFACKKESQIYKDSCKTEKSQIIYCNKVLDVIVDNWIERKENKAEYLSLIAKNISTLDSYFLKTNKLSFRDFQKYLIIKFDMIFKMSAENGVWCDYEVEWKEPFEQENIILDTIHNDPRCNLSVLPIFYIKEKFSKIRNATAARLAFERCGPEFIALRKANPYFYGFFINTKTPEFPSNKNETISYCLHFKKNYIQETSTPLSSGGAENIKRKAGIYFLVFIFILLCVFLN